MDWLREYGSAVVFLLALADGLNLPIPSSAVLLAAGGLAAQGELNLVAVLIAAVAGVFLGNLPWYFLGRRMGSRVLLVLCKLSLNSSSCIGRMESMYRRYGPVSLVGARFIPGLAAIAPPLAGASGLPPRKYLLFDFLGAVVFSGTLLLGGTFFGDLVSRVRESPPDPATLLGLLGLAVLAVLLAKVALRIKDLHLSVPRMTPQELKRRLDRGDRVLLVDARAESMRNLPPWKLPGAVYEVGDPGEGLVVTYCECPHEASAALLARSLPAGRAYALKGGMTAWEKAGFAREAVSP
jgi:membrane protein DedA with SNARE-associated domain/rhodanese-related sulfurtransferase